MKKISREEYRDKVLGSWLGRISGDFVGAPLEFRPYCLIRLQYGNVKYYPKPIDLDYVNDDEMYEICALIALEKHGINLSAKDIAREWVNLLYTQNFTAEKKALKNLKAGIQPPSSGRINNIYYDAIGAQMRADIWGQITPGLPKLAEKYAEMDGSISHADIGVQGEVFIALLLSQAFFEEDIKINIDKALNFLPSVRESLYTRMVKLAIHLYKRFPSNYRKARLKLIQHWHNIRRNIILENESKFSERSLKFLNRFISGVHVLPNAGIITLALLYGAEKEDQLGRSICIAASMGLDTDCNCGNIGAILGAQLGAENILPKWKKPLRNTFSTYVKGYEKWKITELAKRISAIGLNILETHNMIEKN
ncbi:MAG: ADP-ribosylglycohydrolase family protein [Promethearchaeota archaeon]|nr:MAG: ADP-ribosylglycohydrolase family protein [Candidatus Lokiarchaeota archaeon]